MASTGYMGPNEVQALIGKWHDLSVGADWGRRDWGRGDGGRRDFGHGPWQQQQQPWQQQWQQPWQQPGGVSVISTPAHRYGRYGRQQGQGQGILGEFGSMLTNIFGDIPEAPPFPFEPRAAVVDAPLPTQANRDILPMSTGVPILPTQSAQITGRPQTLVFKIGRFVISNGGTAGGAADWIVNDIKIGNVSQFVQSGDVPGDLFATNAIDTFVRFAPAQTAMDVVVVTTYIGLNESGCPFFGAMVGTAAV
jgi:hypothetical protein